MSVYSKRQGRNQKTGKPRKAFLVMETLEDRLTPANGEWVAWFKGLAAATDVNTQLASGQRLLSLSGISEANVKAIEAADLSGAFIVKTPLSTTQAQLRTQLQNVPGFTSVQDFIRLDPSEYEKLLGPVRRSFAQYGPFDYDTFLSREKNGQFPSTAGPAGSGDPERNDVLGNNNGGATGTSQFTQSETSIIAFGNTVILAFNDSGSNAGGTNRFTGWSRSTDGGNTFTDGGSLPTSAGGDAGDPVMARDEVTGRIYFSTLGFSVSTIQVFRSDDGGATWGAPVVGTPGGASEDKQWITVDNFAGAGQGNVYLLSRNFGGGNGIRLYRSTDGGNTFGPNGGTLIVSGMQGAYVAVGPDHSVYCFWYNGATIQMRKSTDFGLTFGAPVVVASGLVGGTNGDQGLTGIRQGTATASGFRSSEFPHVAINPVNGHLYATFANDGPGADKANVFVTVSSDGGATWGAPILVNDDGGTTDQWMPTISVSPDGSRVGVFYYSRQEDAVNNNLFKYYGRIATVSGATLSFLPSFAVSDVASLPEFGRDSLINSVYMGDYNQAVATPGFFHVVWADNRDDLPGGAPRKDPNVYYKKIALGLVVASTNPAQGSTINTQPTSFQINLSDPVLASSIQASDLLVNGIPATGFSYTTGSNTITFTYGSSPVTTEGLQTIHIDAGAFLADPSGDPLQVAYDGSFRYDLVTLQVTSTTPPVGGVFTLPGPLTYDVTFNEPLDPASVQPSDLNLSGIPGAFVVGATLLPGNTTIRFTLNGMTSEGTLTAAIPAGAVTDVFTNPGLTFSGNYEVDFGVVPYPVPLAAKNPRGSLIYDPVAVGRVNVAGDTDNFTINVDPGQRISLILRPTEATLQPRIELFDPNNNSMGFASAGSPNNPTGMQTILAPIGGVYRIEVSSVGGTIGNYSLQLILNAAFELEGLVPGNNNTLATAQDLDGSFINLNTQLASATRGAMMGTTDISGYSAAAISPVFDDIGTIGGTIIPALSNVDDVSVSVPIGFTFPMFGTNYTSVFVSSNGLLTFVSGNTSFGNSNLTTTPAQASIAVFWDDQHTGGGGPFSGVYTQVAGSGANQHLTIQWNQVRFFSGGTAGDTITYQAQLYADGRIQLNYQDLTSGTAAGNNGASATVGIKHLGTQGANRLLLAFNNGPNAFVGTNQSTLISPPTTVPDFTSFSLAAGQFMTASITTSTPVTTNFELRDSGNNVLASGIGGKDNVSSIISNFVAPAAGTYYLFVATPGVNSIPYNLVVTRGADFDTEANNTMATAQDITGPQAALGAIVTDIAGYLSTPITATFEDISTTGTILAALDGADDSAATVPIGFNFTMFGTTFTSVGISSNGLLTFGGTDTSFGNADLTTAPALASIAVFWDDLIVSGGANSHVYTQVTGSGNNQHLTIQWNTISFFSGGTAGDTITFQAQLFADGRIQLNYQDLVSGAAPGNNGASATVGNKAAGTQGPNRTLLAFNNGPNAFVGTNQSTVMSNPPPEDWYTVNITSTAQQLIVETRTPGDGPGEPGNTLNPKIELYNPSGVLVRTGIPQADGRNELLKLRGQTALGLYKVRVMGEGGTTGDYFMSATIVNPVVPSGPRAAVATSSTFSALLSSSTTASSSVAARASAKATTNSDTLPAGINTQATKRTVDTSTLKAMLAATTAKKSAVTASMVDALFAKKGKLV